MGILDLLGKRMVFFDGGTGTMLQGKGLLPGELPERWNLTHPDIIQALHEEYLLAGCDIVKTNTFGANGLKFREEDGMSVSDIVAAAVKLAKNAVAKVCCDRAGFVALDMSSTGKLLEPLGDLSFSDCIALYREVVLAGRDAGCDLILIETMGDLYETKAAVLAAKENSTLPVFVTMVFDESGKLLTGGTAPAMVSLLEGLHIDALGVNCGLGPAQMEGIFEQILACASIPVIVNPNAGLPRCENGKTIFDVGPEEFTQVMRRIAEHGAWAIGGCCGTTPEYIRALYAACRDVVPKPLQKKNRTYVSSYAKCVEIGNRPVVIGERINPTGKSKLKEALRQKNLDYILKEAVVQQDRGAHILDVNVGLPEINEAEMMCACIKELQSITDLPLQIDTTDAETLKQAIRFYNGKPLINSVNGKQESMDSVFPLAAKYGGVIVALTIDEQGIPSTAEERVAIAESIISEAKKYGIEQKDILVDALAMTVSSDDQSAAVTLSALRMLREKGIGTVLGVSNVSFGLPQRESVNAAFYLLAMQNGLLAGIINPCSDVMMRAYDAYMVLSGFDRGCAGYVEKYSNAASTAGVATPGHSLSLRESIEKGLRDSAVDAAKEMLATRKPLDMINEQMIPALDFVGQGFEKGTLFLPQLLMSAEAAKAAFEVLRQQMERTGQVQEKKGKIILATVKGDIHDIGKNIVKVLLENYSYQVIDLGKDVPPEKIVETALCEDVRLVGLSALMTTTVGSMAETIKQLRKAKPDAVVMVGGAVMTEQYADMIGANQYCRDAMASVRYAKAVLGES